MKKKRDKCDDWDFSGTRIEPDNYWNWDYDPRKDAIGDRYKTRPEIFIDRHFLGDSESIGRMQEARRSYMTGQDTLYKEDGVAMASQPPIYERNAAVEKPMMGAECLTDIYVGDPHNPPIRTFQSGATRSADADKLAYKGFISPFALKRFAEYMHKHRIQADGTLRAPDNWKKGIPLASYEESLIRHVIDFWLEEEKNDDTQESIDAMVEAMCGIIFNAQGWLHSLYSEED